MLRLHASCRSWREWITQPSVDAEPSIALAVRDPSDDRVVRALFDPAHAATRGWMHARVGSLELNPDAFPLVAGLPGWIRHGPPDWTLARRLHTLRLTLGSSGAHLRPFASDQPWGRGLEGSASSSLTALAVSWAYSDNVVDALWERLPLLTGLRRLFLSEETRPVDRGMHLPRFEELAALPHLSDLTLSSHGNCVTSAQVDCLCRMPSLTAVAVGSWSEQQRRASQSDESSPDDGDDCRLARFVRARLDSAGPPLRKLDLGQTRLSRKLWREVAQLTTLRRLDPLAWPHDFTAEDWAALLTFPKLEQVRLTCSWDDQLSLPAVSGLLPTLLRCASLTSFALHNSQLNNAQLASLLTPSRVRIAKLELRQCKLGSLGALAVAGSVLEEIELQNCRTLDSKYLRPLESFPTLPGLRKLCIFDSPSVPTGAFVYDDTLLKVAAAGFQRRMPLLTNVILTTKYTEYTEERETSPGCCNVQ